MNFGAPVNGDGDSQVIWTIFSCSITSTLTLELAENS